MPNLRYDITPGGVMVQALLGKPTDEEWEAMLAFLVRHMERLRGGLAIAINDAGPAATHRERLAEILKSVADSVKFVLLTDSKVTRGMNTAVNWLTGRSRQTQTFSRADLDKAMSFLSLSPSEDHATRSMVRELLEAGR